MNKPPQVRASRVAIVGSPEKERAAELLERVQAWLRPHAEVVFAELTYDSARVLQHRPDLLVVLGGDGTLIAVVQGLGRSQTPIVGVNLGKLGFLSEFSLEQLESDGRFLFQGELPLTRRLMLDVRVENSAGLVYESPAVNDCVILAGPPYRMIELRLEVDGDDMAELRGDGLIIATASGSTAHNLSSGGPILDPTAEAYLLTPICAHALTFRPLALDAARRVVIRGARVNEGTAVLIDGHVRCGLRPGDRLTVSRYPADFLLVRNPERSAWFALRRKLMWGENPRNSG